MAKRLFFLRQDGWFEAEVTAKLLNSNEELFLWAYAMMDRHNYRNYLVTENPGRIPGDTPFHTDRLLRRQYTGYKTQSSGTPPRNDDTAMMSCT